MLAFIVAATLAIPAFATERHSFEVPALEAPAAIREFASQAKVQILVAGENVEGKRLNAVSGELSTQRGLEILLANSGLAPQYVGERSIALVSETSARPDINKGDTDLSASSQAGSSEKTGVWSRLRLALAEDDGKQGTLSADTGGEGTGGSGKGTAQDIMEVVVNARRREENLQSVPIAITALSQDDLRRNDINSLRALQGFVPSLNVAYGFGRNSVAVTLRGQGVNDLSARPSVITYLHEVPIPTDLYGQSVGGPGLYYDLDSVQVLKGPQGTLFGRNTTGGAILFQPKGPLNATGAHVQLTYGNYENKELDGAVNLPLVEDELAIRVAVNARERDGFTRSLADPVHPNGRKMDNSKYFSSRVSLSYRPGETFRNDFIFDRLRYEDNGQAMILTRVNPAGLLAQRHPEAAAILGQQQALGKRTQVPVSVVMHAADDLDSFINKTEFALAEHLTLRNILGYITLDREGADERDGTRLPFIDLLAYPTRTEQYTEELQLQGVSLGDKLQWTTGLFYLKTPLEDFSTSESVVFGNSRLSSARNRTQSKAGYAQGTYDLGSWAEGLKLTAGLRYTWDESLGETVTSTCTDPGCVTRLEGESEALTWNVGLDYHVARNALIYVASRRGYRPGGANASTLTAFINQPYGPEYVTDQELGLKWNGRIGSMPTHINAAVYHQEYTDAQVRQQVPVVINGVPALTVITANAAGARTYGAELESSINLLSRLRLGLNVSALDFRYKDFKPGVDPRTLIAAERSGRPELTYGVSALFDVPMDERLGDLSFSATWNWQDTTGYDPSINGPGTDIPSFGLLNLNAAWDHIGGSSIDGSLYVSNALDEEFIVNTYGNYYTTGHVMHSYGDPRVYGLRLRYRFGAQ